MAGKMRSDICERYGPWFQVSLVEGSPGAGNLHFLSKRCFVKNNEEQPYYQIRHPGSLKALNTARLATITKITSHGDISSVRKI